MLCKDQHCTEVLSCSPHRPCGIHVQGDICFIAAVQQQRAARLVVLIAPKVSLLESGDTKGPSSRAEVIQLLCDVPHFAISCRRSAAGDASNRCSRMCKLRRSECCAER
eukprot:20214-Heterococcus_DN1.PRE.5